MEDDKGLNRGGEPGEEALDLRHVTDNGGRAKKNFVFTSVHRN